MFGPEKKTWLLFSRTRLGATINLIKTASPYQLYVSDDILSVREATSGNCNTINLCYKGSQPRSWQGLAVLNRFSFGDGNDARIKGARSTSNPLRAIVLGVVSKTKYSESK